MADALTGLTEVSTPTVETIVSAEVQEVLTASMVVWPTLLDYSSMCVPGMNTLKLPKFSNFTVQDKSENTVVEAQINAFDSDSLVMDKHKVIQFLVEDIAELQSKVAVMSVYAAQCAKDMALAIDQVALDAMEAGVSTSAPDHKRAYLATYFLKADVLLARQLLNTQNVPQNDRFIVISPAQEAQLLGVAEFTKVSEAGDSAALRNGQIGALFGFAVLVTSIAEDAKSMCYHRSTMAVAKQLAPRVQTFNDIPNLAQRWSIDCIFGVKMLDGGKRAVLSGTA